MAGMRVGTGSGPLEPFRRGSKLSKACKRSAQQTKHVAQSLVLTAYTGKKLTVTPRAPGALRVSHMLTRQVAGETLRSNVARTEKAAGAVVMWFGTRSINASSSAPTGKRINQIFFK